MPSRKGGKAMAKKKKRDLKDLTTSAVYLTSRRTWEGLSPVTRIKGNEKAEKSRKACRGKVKLPSAWIFLKQEVNHKQKSRPPIRRGFLLLEKSYAKIKLIKICKSSHSHMSALYQDHSCTYFQ